MIIFYGHTHLAKKHRVREWTFCPQCKAGVELVSYTAFEWFNIYWIPLIPVGSVRAVFLCPSCDKYYKFSTSGKKRQQAIADNRRRAGEALAAGQDIVNEATMLAHLGDFEGAEAFIAQARSAGRDMMASAAHGRVLQMQGQAAPAEEQFQRALQADGAHPAPHYWYARFLLDAQRDEEAIAQLRQVPCDGEYGYLDLLNVLSDLRRRQGRWAGAVTLLEAMLRLAPGLGEDENFAKALDKARRKCGHVDKLSDDQSNPYAMR